MNAEESFSGSMDGGEAVVTYSRVPARRRHMSAPTRDEPPAAVADTVDMSFGPGDLRAERTHFVYDGGRPGYLRYGLVGATVALIAGVGLLAVSAGTATLVPGEFASNGRGAGLSGSGPQGDMGSPSASVREIPLPSGPSTTSLASVEQGAVEMAPPIPRPRPEDGDDKWAATEAAVPVLPAPEASAEDTADGAAAPASAVASAAPAPEPSETDGLIAKIEEALARIDASEAADAAETESRVAEVGTASPAPRRDDAPSVVMTQPTYPSATSSQDLSDSAGSGDISAGVPIPPEPLPPAPIVDGAYPSVPIPPEAVPQAYPRGDNFYYGPGPAYPYDVNPPEAEAPRPGLLRRSFAKAGNAVGRVLRLN